MTPAGFPAEVVYLIPEYIIITTAIAPIIKNITSVICLIIAPKSSLGLAEAQTLEDPPVGQLSDRTIAFTGLFK